MGVSCSLHAATFYSWLDVSTAFNGGVGSFVGRLAHGEDARVLKEEVRSCRRVQWVVVEGIPVDYAGLWN